MTAVNNTMPQKRGRKKKNIQSVLNKHLLPFFKDLEFKDITDETIEKFKIQKLSEGYRPAGISIFLTVLQEITSRYI
ncbi:MAG: hypothetical protein WCG95_08225 [bacterium]